jgi:transaldolase
MLDFSAAPGHAGAVHAARREEEETMPAAREPLPVRVQHFVLEKARSFDRASSFGGDPFWQGLRELGTELWLDTGDLQAAAGLWTAEFAALTTNNTLLNKEIQKGIYDSVIEEAGPLLEDAELSERVVEIAFLLNALHGLKLVAAFGARVSVELHTALAQDVRRTLAYARRFHAISPESFVIKVPLTAAGLVATRILRLEGIPVNFTLGFSARHNHLAAAFAFPSFVNVFLGRLNAYVADNGLGDGRMVGEKATLASQRAVRRLSDATGRKTRQIAASIRSGEQVRDLAGVDVMTIPIAAAAEARRSLSGRWESALDKNYPVGLGAGVSDVETRIGVLWDVGQPEKELARSLDARAPESAEELIERAKAAGAGDLFPRLSRKDLDAIAAHGKIPTHSHWASRIAAGELAVDTLLNLAGLASFTADQAALDERIRGLIA